MSEPGNTAITAQPDAVANMQARTTVPRRRPADLSLYDCSDLSERSGLDFLKDRVELTPSLEFFPRYRTWASDLLEVGAGSNVLEQSLQNLAGDSDE